MTSNTFLTHPLPYLYLAFIMLHGYKTIGK